MMSRGSPTRPRIVGVVLCGGAGRRFDGADKPLLELAGRRLVVRVLERLADQVDEIVISANRNLEDYRALGHPVVTDALTDRGPLEGVLAGAGSSRAELVFVCPGDSPLLPRNLVDRLAQSLADGVDAVLPSDGQRRQHLFVLLRRAAVAGIESYLASGGRSVAGWLDTLRTAVVAVDERRAFTNVNSPQELEALENSAAFE